MENRAVFLIDGPNFYKNLRRCGLERGHLDFTRLAENLSGPRTVAGVVFFTSPTDRESDAENYANQQRFFAALQKSGVQIMTLPDAIKHIRNSGLWSTSDNRTWTRTLTDVSDYRLLPSSPCINAGTPVGLTTDFLGHGVSGIPDIGAYEFYGSRGGTGFGNFGYDLGF